MRTVLLAQHTYWWREDNVRDVEDGQDKIVLVGLEMEILVHAIRLRIAQIALVERIAEVHERKDREDAKVELQSQRLLVLVRGEVLSMALDDPWVTIWRGRA